MELRGMNNMEPIDEFKEARLSNEIDTLKKTMDSKDDLIVNLMAKLIDSLQYTVDLQKDVISSAQDYIGELEEWSEDETDE